MTSFLDNLEFSHLIFNSDIQGILNSIFFFPVEVFCLELLMNLFGKKKENLKSALLIIYIFVWYTNLNLLSMSILTILQGLRGYKFFLILYLIVLCLIIHISTLIQV